MTYHQIRPCLLTINSLLKFMEIAKEQKTVINFLSAHCCDVLTQKMLRSTPNYCGHGCDQLPRLKASPLMISGQSKG